MTQIESHPPLHPFDIEYPAEYYRTKQEDMDADMSPFDCWDFFFDNGWGASVLDAHNDPDTGMTGIEGKMWIVDFGAWETVGGVKRFHHGRHPQIDDHVSLTPLTTDQVSDYLHRICRFAYRRFGASKVAYCGTCKKSISRSDDITFDEIERAHHLHCW